MRIIPDNKSEGLSLFIHVISGVGSGNAFHYY